MNLVAHDTISLKQLPEGAKKCQKFDEVTIPLVLVSQLCKHNMSVVFDSRGFLVNNSNNETVIKRHLDLNNNPYIILMDGKNDINFYDHDHKNPRQQASMNAVELPKHRASIAYSIKCIQKLIKYLHTTARFPVKKTWLATIAKGWYITWPGLTVERVPKRLDLNEHTTMGHMTKLNKNFRSTKKSPPVFTQHTAPPDIEPTTVSTSQPRSVVHNVIMQVITREELTKEMIH